MDSCPIRFEFRGKEVFGHFEPVFGAGNAYHWHLTVDRYHWGQLFYTNKWKFYSPSMPDLNELEDFFGDYVTAWYG